MVIIIIIIVKMRKAYQRMAQILKVTHTKETTQFICIKLRSFSLPNNT